MTLHPPSLLRYLMVLLLAALWLPPAGAAPLSNPPLVLLVQPLPEEERTAASYDLLARYIESITGQRCTIHAPSTFPAYWDVVRRNRYELVLDGPHFTDYRVYKFGFTVLAKAPDTASYTLVVRPNARLTDPLQLVGRRIASFGLLSMGHIRLNAMFANPMRQPVIVEVQSADEAFTLLTRKRVEAAFLPTPVVHNRLAQSGFTVMLTTEPVARLALSASPRLPPEQIEKIRERILQAHQTEAGQAMLKAIGFTQFEPAAAETFANQRNVLKSYWGY